MQGMALAHPGDLEQQMAVEQAHHLAHQQALAGHHMPHDMQPMPGQDHLDQAAQYAPQVKFPFAAQFIVFGWLHSPVVPQAVSSIQQ